MKSKTKKLLAVLGLSAVMSCGGFISGCSNLNLSQNQVDRLVEIAENADNFMQATQNQYDKISREDALGLLKGAITSLMTNHSGECDNVKIVGHSDYGNSWLKLFKTDNGKGLLVSYDDDEDCEIWLQEDHSDTIHLKDGVKTKLDGINFYTIVNEMIYDNIFYKFDIDKLSQDDIISIVQEENRGCSISFVYNGYTDEDYNFLRFYELIVDESGRIKYIVKDESDIDHGSCRLYNSEIELQYSVLTDEEMQTYINMINNAT